MKVLFVLRRLDCNDGVASHCETLIARLSDAGVQVYVAIGAASYDNSTLVRYRSICERAAGLFVYKSLTPNGLRKITKKVSPDLIHAHGLSCVPLLRVASLGLSTKIVATAHPSQPGRNNVAARSGIKKIAVKMLGKILGPDVAIAISSEVREWFINDLGLPVKCIRLIPNGVCADYFRQPTKSERENARIQFDCKNDEFVCSIVGRLDQGNKGHDLLVTAIAKLISEGRKMRLLIAGDGDGRERIKSLLNESYPSLHGCSRMLGYTPHLRDLYWASDASVLPSYCEGFGLVIAEAMLCGVCPVRTPTGGAADQIIEGKTGLLFPVGDSEKLAEQLRWLADHTEERSEMGKRAAERARENFTVNAMAANTIAVYNELSGNQVVSDIENSGL